MNIYEDEDENRDTSVIDFIKANKQIVIMLVAFVFAYVFMSWTSNSLDAAVAAEKAQSKADHRSPWAKDE